MKAVTKYVANDGREFMSAEECTTYEDNTQAVLIKVNEHEGNLSEALIAWFEKQGEQKLPIEKLPSEMKTTGESLGFTTQEECDRYNQMVTDSIMSDNKGGQKSTDKVEPKFKVGDWINGYYTNYEVLSVNNKGYVVEDVDGNKINILFENEKFHHLWTIKDAKDGDVLCYKNEISLYKHDIKNCTKQEATFGGFVYYCCYDGKRFIMGSLYSLTEQDKIDVYPATKEQRNLLFQKMKEAGYEWDDEKKELKKIGQTLAWSE